MGVKQPHRPPTTIFLDASDPVVRHLHDLIHTIIEQGKCLMASNAELTADLQKVSAQVQKISGETSTTLQKVSDLEAALAAVGTTSPEVDQALTDLKTQVQLVDDLIQDAPPAEPTA